MTHLVDYLNVQFKQDKRLATNLTSLELPNLMAYADSLEPDSGQQQFDELIKLLISLEQPVALQYVTSLNIPRARPLA